MGVRVVFLGGFGGVLSRASAAHADEVDAPHSRCCVGKPD